MTQATPPSSVLGRVNSSGDVKQLSRDELHQLADELRSEIIRVCSIGGGHLASSLGTVELTVALHALYNSQQDRIVWDVGHQTYGHKILTGRKDRIDSIRKPDGLAGFSCTSESPDDALTVGHASTSLAAALGMALARDARGADYDVIGVIGDGALTGGMALAALNQIGHVKPKLTLILNDNEMSISENVGALNSYMRTLQVQKWFQNAESSGKRFLSGTFKPLADFGSRAKQAFRRFFDPASANPFHAMGVRYVGPIDGHDVDQLIYYLDRVRQLDGPTLLHIVTKKGKGYKIAESEPITWHGASKFDPDMPVAAGKGYTWSNAFGDAAIKLAQRDDRIWVITPAMREGSGLVEYSRAHPNRYLDVGIAEDVSVTTAAGLALRGEKPIVAIYSTFLQRGYDQVIHDVCIENLDVVFAIDRAGLVGGDGATHQGVYDIAYLRPIPNMSVAMPKDAPEMQRMLKAALRLGGPKAIRWPRGKVEAAPESSVDDWGDIEWGSWEIVKEGRDAFVLAIGVSIGDALEATRDLPGVGVVNARFIDPLDEAMLLRLARDSKALITAEDHAVTGGLGSAVAEVLSDHDIDTPLRRLGVPQVHVPHGDPKAQRDEFGYGPTAIREALQALGVATPALLEASD
ncbi:MAG: 1-deoxy-D-xylulose-5-phosphate synthase [Trueperaceae bacterium]|nr:1-deoxy-D-xylulose-5-phosphate synthase [Trueperaceae bacterium]